MSEPVIMPVKPGTILPEDKQALRDVGVIVIECYNPDEIRLIRPSAEVDSSTLLQCALKALNASDTHGSKQREAFTKALCGAVIQKHEPRKEKCLT